ncbi:DUF674 family protein, partial [Trifolium medium]|nr:DUF674 family protein [Trifolium medium]
NEKVLFAEASKPVIGNKGMVGSIGNLYQSVENLNHNYMQQNLNKDVLLNPSAPRWSIEIAHRLPPQEEPLKTLSATSAVFLEDELDKEDQRNMTTMMRTDEDEEDEDEEEVEESEEDSLVGETMFYMCPNE